jgi:hypothetical protein
VHLGITGSGPRRPMPGFANPHFLDGFHKRIELVILR